MPIESPSFYAMWIRAGIKELYSSLPGPWWVKLLIVGICLAIPGPQDEILLLIVIKVCRMRRARKVSRETQEGTVS